MFHFIYPALWIYNWISRCAYNSLAANALSPSPFLSTEAHCFAVPLFTKTLRTPNINTCKTDKITNTKRQQEKKKTRMQTGMHAQTNKILECMFTSWISLYKLGKPAVTGQLLLTTENRLYFCRGTHGYAIMFIIFFFSTALLLCLTNMLHIITALSAHTVKKKLTQLLLFFFLQKCLHIHQ